MKTAPKTILCHNYHWYDHNKLKDDLKNADCSHSISDSLEAFNRILTEFFDWHASFLTKRTNTNISPWLTVKLKNEIDCRDVLQWKFCKSKTTENYVKYKHQRNKVNNLIKRAKLDYKKNLQDKNTKKLLHSGEYWKVYFPPNRN